MKTDVATLESTYKALADATRLRILALLADGEVCVCDIHDTLRVPQPTASRHLAYLRQAGLVEARREGTWMHYRIAELDPVIRALPTAWPRRRVSEHRELPLILPNVHAAAVAPDGGVWVALGMGYVYAFDAAGDKTGVYELHGAGRIRPSSLAFSRAGRLIVTPDGYEFDVRESPAKNRAAPGSTR